ncbi:hypothetical protein FHR81_003561 [Actinoalloteichus hoggarensis]|uniref:Uncharacterized protein n=1 Tax=Actinoalloteichus hoggarensis TaxID=1470176 RepID=A0A221WA68_9PSEU|nr:hypothetical protein AHOG_26490 [Actinoalloteichus hoggarensis]MBB5922504.1 hypothetical protein [Actinoalloteichus hoggarensis]
MFVFGGSARLAYHGVPKVYPNTADPEIGLSAGRVNITLRVTGRSQHSLGEQHEDRGSTNPPKDEDR